MASLYHTADTAMFVSFFIVCADDLCYILVTISIRNQPTMIYYLGLSLIGAIYLILSVTNPISSTSNTLMLTDFQIRLLQITIAVPFAASWLAGAIGYRELKKYAVRLKDKNQIRAFSRIALGINILVFSSILTSFISLLRTRLTPEFPQILPWTTIISNYLYTFSPLAGLSLILTAIKSLTRTIKAPELTKTRLYLSLLFPVAFMALNGYLIATNPARQTPDLLGGSASYYLPDALIIATIFIPSALTWIIGTLAILQAQNYQKHATGTIFQGALTRFTLGLLAVIVAAVFLQLILALGSSRLLGIGLSGLLAVIYAFVILQTLGYILIALGSRKFSLVEQILSKYTIPTTHETPTQKI